LLASPASAEPEPWIARVGDASAGEAARAVLERAVPAARGAELALGVAQPSPRATRFVQIHEGVPVVGRGAALLGRQLASARIETRLPSTRPAIDAASAAEAARALTGRPANEPRLALWPTPAGAALVWVVFSPATAWAPTAPVVLVDAVNGAPRATFDAALALKQGHAFAANPVSTPALSTVSLDVEAPGLGLASPRLSALNCVDHKDLTNVTIGGTTLAMHVCHVEPVATADANGDYLFMPAGDTVPEDPFAEVSLFHHATVVYDFFVGLGLGKLMTQPLPIVANLMLPSGMGNPPDLAKLKDPEAPLEPFGEAIFSPGDPLLGGIYGIEGAVLWFGQGKVVDFSYDGDVVYHELTHAVFADLVGVVGTLHLDEQGGLPSPLAVNEAIADYFSCAVTGDPLLGEHAAKELAGGKDAVRRLDNEARCPDDLSGEPHHDSLAVSGTLWMVRAALGEAERKAFDQAVFDALLVLPGGDLAFEDLLGAVASTVEASPLGPTVAAALRDEAKTRGLLEQCERVRAFTGEPLASSDEAAGKRFVASGTLKTGLGNAAHAPGVVQAKMELPTHAQKLTFRYDVPEITVPSGPGQGTPFTPRVLVRFDQPIRFDWKSFSAEHDADLEPTAEGGTHSVTLAVPAGAKLAYAMVVNAGHQDGLYGQLRFEVEAGSGPPPETAGSSGSGGAAATPPPGGPAAEADGGCACRTVATGAPLSRGAAAALALLAIGWLARRRRRRS
jgi:MYXO-CTERM domain-containing protein